MDNPVVPPYQYGKGYIYLPVKLATDKLPESISVSSTANTLLKKDSFHVSLVCVKAILGKFPEAQQKTIEEDVLNIFNKHAEQNPIRFLRFNNEFRFAHREDKESLIVMCETTDLSDLFLKISQKVGFEVPVPPTHVTLYTLQKNVGIGINNQEELGATQTVSSDEFGAVRTALEIRSSKAL